MNSKILFVCAFLSLLFKGKSQSIDIWTNDTLGCAPYNASFQSNVPTGATLLWDFGNGQQSTAMNPTMAYLNPGTYTVKLTITTPLGIDSVVKTNYIEVQAKPIADFTINQQGNCLNDNLINLNNTSSNANNFFWNFGDGNSSNIGSPAHTYQTTGSPTITLFASNSIGCTNAKSQTLTQAISLVPNLNFNHSNIQLCDTADFFQVSYLDTFQTISWTFGDGTVDSNASFNHTYNSFGDFPVSFELLDTNGCLYYSDTVLVNVLDVSLSNPLADTNVCANGQLNLTLNNPQGFNPEWYFNGNLVSTSNTCLINSSNTGNYPLTVTGSKNGCYDTLSVSNIFVGSAEYLNVHTSGDTICKNESLSLSCDPLLTNIQWFVNGNQVSSDSAFTTSFQNSGQSQIYLQAQTSGGCLIDTTIFVEVVGEPSVASFNNNVGCAPLTTTMSASNINNGTFEWISDGLSSFGSTHSQNYSTGGFHNVDLVTTDGYGCVDTLHFASAINVQAIDINHSPIVIERCAPYELNLTYSMDGNNTWLWNPGNGTPVTNGQNLNTMYTAGGTYVVSLETFNSNGCSAMVDSFAIVHIKDAVDFQPFYSVDCAQNALNLTDSLGFSSIQWSIDLSGISGTGGTINMPDSGNHVVLLSLVDTNGCVSVEAFSGGATICDSLVAGGAAAGTPSSAIPGAPIGFNTSLPSDTLHSCDDRTYVFEYVTNPIYQFVAWDMGDGTVYNTPQVMHNYQTVGTYLIKLLLDSSGVMDTLYYQSYINIQQYQPTADYLVSGSCDGIMVDYEAINSDSTVWNIQGLPQQFSNQITHTYGMSQSVYFTEVDMFSNESCYDFQEIIHVLDTAEKVFIYQDSVCLSDTIFLFNNYHSSVQSIWHIGSDTVSGNSAFFVSNQAGDLPVWIELNRPNICSDTVLLDSVHIREAVSAWTLTQDSICKGEELLIVASDTSQTSYVWQVNGITQNANNSPEFIFERNNAALYHIELIVDNQACQSSHIDSVLVQGPQANFQINQPGNCYPSNVDFVSTSINEQQWQWDFGDGNVSSMENPSHIFSQYPSAPVTLKVTDEQGCADSIQKFNFKQFNLELSLNAFEGCAPLNVQMEATGASVAHWNWDLGNGTTSTDSIVFVQYSDTGHYDVQLIGTSQFGCTDTVLLSNAVTVYDVFANPTIQLASNACAPAQYGFSANAYNASSVNWDFGDGSSSALTNDSHYYLYPGAYQVSLNVVSPEGCSKHLQVPNLVDVIGPTAIFSPSTTVCLGDTSNFLNQSLNAQMQTWYFGDGTTSNALNPSNSYQQPGLYDVTLVVSDTMGCSNSQTIVAAAEVHGLPNPQFSFTDTLQCEHETIGLQTNQTNYQMMTGFDGHFNGNQTEFYPDNTGWAAFNIVETDSNGCSNTFTDSIFVEKLIYASITDPGLICEDQDSLHLNVDMSGGIWSGPGISSIGAISPATLEHGIYQYAYTYGSNCPTIDSVTITINEKLNANFLAPTAVCQVDTNLFFQPVQDTGFWYINGQMASNYLNPNDVAAGQLDISHVVYNGACYDSADVQLLIRPLPNMDVVLKNEELCYGSELSIDGFIASNYEQQWHGYHVETDSTYEFTVLPEINLAGNWSFHLTLSDEFSCTSEAYLGDIFMLDTISPSSPEVIRTTVIEDQYTYTEWEPVNEDIKITGYHIWRVDESGKEELVDSLDKRASYYTDFHAEVHQSKYDYKITSINKCNLRNKASVGNSILLEGETVKGQSNQFKWNPYTNWETGVDHYELQVLGEDFQWKTIKVIPGNMNVTDY